MDSISPILPASTMLPQSLNAAQAAQQPSVEMAQDFESLILAQLLKQMRSTSEEEGGLFPGDKSDTYGGMFDMYFGQFLAEKGGLGLTEFISEQFEARQSPAPVTPVAAVAGTAVVNSTEASTETSFAEPADATTVPGLVRP